MKIKNIVLIPTHGFGNRIKAITSAKILAHYLDIPLYINWQLEDCIYAKYEDIFSDNPCYFNFNKLENYTYIYKPTIHTEQTLLDCIKKITFEKNKITNTKKIKKTFKIIFKNSSFFKLILLKKLKKNNEKKIDIKKFFSVIKPIIPDK